MKELTFLVEPPEVYKPEPAQMASRMIPEEMFRGMFTNKI